MGASLDIVIVNWNTGECLKDCLDSIAGAAAGIDLHRVMVVDNASRDFSQEGIKTGGIPLRVLVNPVNRGFAAACNQGAQGSDAGYLLFLNPDTRLGENSLRLPLNFMEDPRHQDVGIVGIQLADEAGRVARTCAYFPTPGWFLAKSLGLNRIFPGLLPRHFMTEWDHRESREVDQVMGAFFLVRRSAFEALGGFDQRFFVYFEDADFALRAKQAGWRSFFLASAQAYHKGGGASAQAKAARLFYSLRSRVLFAYKHFSPAAATAVLLETTLLEPISRVVWALARASWGEVRETLKGFGLFWRGLPATLRSAGRGVAA